MYPAEIVIAGETVCGAANLRAETFALSERGPQKIQNVSLIIGKHLLSTAPEQGTMIEVNGLAFKVVEVAGQNSGDEDWYLTGQRTPGSDKPTIGW